MRKSSFVPYESPTIVPVATALGELVRSAVNAADLVERNRDKRSTAEPVSTVYELDSEVVAQICTKTGLSASEVMKTLCCCELERGVMVNLDYGEPAWTYAFPCGNDTFHRALDAAQIDWATVAKNREQFSPKAKWKRFVAHLFGGSNQ